MNKLRDSRKSSNPSDYMIENKNDETVVKLPGTLNGTQFILQNLEVKMFKKNGVKIFVLKFKIKKNKSELYCLSFGSYCSTVR